MPNRKWLTVNVPGFVVTVLVCKYAYIIRAMLMHHGRARSESYPEWCQTLTMTSDFPRQIEGRQHVPPFCWHISWPGGSFAASSLIMKFSWKTSADLYEFFSTVELKHESHWINVKTYKYTVLRHAGIFISCLHVGDSLKSAQISVWSVFFSRQACCWV